MTELEFFEVITDRLGRRPVDKIEALQELRKLIVGEPAWITCFPETLLDKLGIKYDYKFNAIDCSLAAAIKGNLIRRLL